MSKKALPTCPVRSLTTALVLAAAATLPSARVVAVEAVSNLTPPQAGGSALGVISQQWRAVSFLTGASAMTLDSVEIGAKDNTQFGVGTGFTLTLAADPDGIFGGNPGGGLSILSGPQPGVTGIYGYTDPLDTLLDANTPYWLIASVDPGSPSASFHWFLADSVAETGLPDWQIAYVSHYYNQVEWYQTQSEVPLGFRVNASEISTEVPEASTWAAGGLVALMAATAWRRQQKPRQG